MRRLFLEMKFSNAPLSRSDHRLPASGIAPLVPALVRSLIEERPKQCPHFRPPRAVHSRCHSPRPRRDNYLPDKTLHSAVEANRDRLDFYTLQRNEWISIRFSDGSCTKLVEWSYGMDVVWGAILRGAVLLVSPVWSCTGNVQGELR